MMISGFVGFEALCRGKPVIAMGRTFFEILPDTMYRRIGDPEALPAVLREMLETFELDDAALVRFVAAVVGESIRLDWYGVSRGVRERKGGTFEQMVQDDERMASYASLAALIARQPDFPGGQRTKPS